MSVNKHGHGTTLVQATKLAPNYLAALDRRVDGAKRGITASKPAYIVCGCLDNKERIRSPIRAIRKSGLNLVCPNACRLTLQ